MKSYRPEELFDANGRLVARSWPRSHRGARRMGTQPAANGGGSRAARPSRDFDAYAVDVPRPGASCTSRRARLASCCATSYRDNPRPFRLMCPDETNSNRLGAVFEVENRCFDGADDPDRRPRSADGRVMEVLSEHNCEGGSRATS